MQPERLKAWFRERLLGRRLAFQRCFLDEFGNPTKDGEIVLRYLSKFCHARRSTLKRSPVTGMADPLAMAHAEGRREVWNLLVEHLHLQDRFIVNLREEIPNDD